MARPLHCTGTGGPGAPCGGGSDRGRACYCCEPGSARQGCHGASVGVEASVRGARAGGAARLRGPSARVSLDTLAMKFSAELLSTGGGTQVRHHHQNLVFHTSRFAALELLSFSFKTNALTF